MSDFQGEQVPAYIKKAIEEEEDEEEKETKENKELKEFQEKAMELLELYGVVEQKGGHAVVDLNKIKDFNNRLISGEPSEKSYKMHDFDKIKEVVSYNNDSNKEQKERLEEVKKVLKDIGYNYFDYFESDARHFLLSAFKDKKVVTKEDFENDELEEKPLFYHPESKEEAFDKKRIKNADFHIGPWEINTQLGTEEYSPFIEDMDYNEASLAAVIYNQNYGNGEREGATLKVRGINPENGKFLNKKQGISRDWIRSIYHNNRFYGTDIYSSDFSKTPRKALKEGVYENLKNEKLLRSADFESTSTSRTTEKYGILKTIRNRTAAVTLKDGIRYTLGSEYGGGENAVISIGKDSYGVVSLSEDGEPIELEAIVDRVDPEKEEVKEKLKDDAGNIKRLGKRDLDDLGYIHELNDEDEWSDIDISEVLEAKKEVVSNTDISLESLTKEELLAFLEFYENKKENQPKDLEAVYDFVKTYGTYGLRSFASLEYSGFSGEELIDIMEKTETRADAIPIFRKYNEIMDKVDNLEEEIKLFFKQNKDEDINPEQLSFEIADRASKALTTGLKAEGKTYEEIEQELEELDEEIITFTSIFKTAFKGEKEVDFESVRGLSFETQTVDEISEEDKDEMTSISEDNWKQREAGKDVYENLEEMLEEETTESNFHILKKDGEVVAFVRMEPPESNHKYAASLNVDPDYRSSAIGEAMLKNTLAKEAEDYIIDATVFPELRVGTKYVEDFDFNIVGIDTYEKEDEEKGSEEDVKKIFKIRIDKDKNNKLRTKDKENFPYEKIKKKYENFFENKELNQLKEADEEIIIRKYDIESDDNYIYEVEDLTDSGYEVTRYFSDDKSNKNEENKSKPVRYFVFEKVD